MKGKKHTARAKEKMSLSHTGKFRGGNSPNASAVINIDTKVEFECINDAAKFYSIFPSGISAACRKVIKTTGGYKWMYLIEYYGDKT